MTDYTKLIEDLRGEAEFYHNHATLSMLLCAADAIEALQAENELLKGYRDRALELATAYNNAQENLEQIGAHREHILASNDKLRKERNTLRAQLEAMQRQAPVEYQSFTKPGFTSSSPASWEPCTPEQYQDYLSEGTPVRKLYAAPKAQEPLTWQPIETAPKDGRKIIVTYANRNGLKRTVMACWLTSEAAAENDADDVGLEEGWYESIDNWNDYTEVAIHEGEPTHWMPLPKAPSHGIGSQ